jgi:hypothetical protein
VTRVLKYGVRLAGSHQHYALAPADAEFLSAGVQGSTMVVWALVEEEGPLMRRPLVVTNTGAEARLSKFSRFLGTVTSDAGIVWHVWSDG